MAKIDTYFSNPLVVVLSMIIVLIVILAIFRTVSPFLTMGVGINAHLGSLRGSLALEAYKNREHFQTYGDVNKMLLSRQDNKYRDNDDSDDDNSDDSDDDDDDNNNDDGKPEFVMYYADWCGHCKRAKPHFENIMKKYNGPVKLKMINAEDPMHKDIVKKEQISGYPTIRYYPNGCMNGNGEDYEDERNEEGFGNYLNSRN